MKESLGARMGAVFRTQNRNHIMTGKDHKSRGERKSGQLQSAVGNFGFLNVGKHNKVFDSSGVTTAKTLPNGALPGGSANGSKPKSLLRGSGKTKLSVKSGESDHLKRKSCYHIKIPLKRKTAIAQNGFVDAKTAAAWGQEREGGDGEQDGFLQGRSVDHSLSGKSVKQTRSDLRRVSRSQRRVREQSIQHQRYGGKITATMVFTADGDSKEDIVKQIFESKLPPESKMKMKMGSEVSGLNVYSSDEEKGRVQEEERVPSPLRKPKPYRFFKVIQIMSGCLVLEE